MFAFVEESRILFMLYKSYHSPRARANPYPVQYKAQTPNYAPVARKFVMPLDATHYSYLLYIFGFYCVGMPACGPSGCS